MNGLIRLVVWEHSHVDSGDEGPCRDACDSVCLGAAETGLPVLGFNFYSEGEILEAVTEACLFLRVAEPEVAEDRLFRGGVAWDAWVGGVEEPVSSEDACLFFLVAG